MDKKVLVSYWIFHLPKRHCPWTYLLDIQNIFYEHLMKHNVTKDKEKYSHNYILLLGYN